MPLIINNVLAFNNHVLVSLAGMGLAAAGRLVVDGPGLLEGVGAIGPLLPFSSKQNVW